ncbi:MAG: OPT/YSL family transporter [Deltaproteobacteria bacterium]|nr:OPT/YSL family transporter [Deltaproteobacteria bacterium]
MAEAIVPPPAAAAAAAAQPEAPRRELTARALITAFFVALLIGATYPYVVLKIGYGPNISVVSAFFGFIALAIAGAISGIRGTRHETNLVQTAGTAAGEAGFMCVVLAAMDMLNQKPELGFHVSLTPLQIFLWLTVAGLLGVLLAVPLRKHFIDEENLTFADGTAAGETMLVLDADRNQAKARVGTLFAGMIASGLVALVRDFTGKLHWFGGRIIEFKEILPGEVYFSKLWANAAAMKNGSEVGLLGFGSGLLVGLRVTLSMGLGMVISWFILPGQLHARGIIESEVYKDTLRWAMWPATGLMVAGGLTALILKWKLIVKTFQGLKMSDVSSTDFPMKWVLWGVGILTVLLCVVQKISLNFPVWLTLVSLVLSIPLMLVGIRVLGETNWAPISAMANFMQAVFAGLAPGSMPINMIGSGMSGSVAAHGEHLMQDFRAGKMVGSTNKNLTIVQLLAVPVGALAVSFAYPLYKEQYGIGGNGLSSPISVKWAGFAELLAKGFEFLPRGCFTAMLVALVIGSVLTLLEPKFHKYVPSPTGVGLGMLIPTLSIFPMVVGGIVQHLWQRANPQHEEKYNTPLASGFIAGEAVIVLVIAILKGASLLV